MKGMQNILAWSVSEDNCVLYVARRDITVCPNCHSLFTKNIIVLSLPIPVLKYIKKYLISTPKVNQKPLYMVRHVLR
jgi:hypothetical protein